MTQSIYTVLYGIWNMEIDEYTMKKGIWCHFFKYQHAKSATTTTKTIRKQKKKKIHMNSFKWNRFSLKWIILFTCFTAVEAYDKHANETDFVNHNTVLWHYTIWTVVLQWNLFFLRHVKNSWIHVCCKHVFKCALKEFFFSSLLILFCIFFSFNSLLSKSLKWNYV